MQETVDIAIIGGGPAGLSAALNANVRNKRLLLFSGDYRESGLYKAEQLDNVLGMPGLTGKAYLEACLEHVTASGTQITQSKVLSIMPMGKTLMISAGPEVYSARAVILTSGIVMEKTYPGERELLGRGVSYCATCDGMLYRKKQVCVVAKSGEAVHEANYLQEIGCQVTVISDGRDLTGLSKEIPVVTGRKLCICGEGQVQSIEVDGEGIACQGVFILRNTVAMSSLLPGLKLEDGHIWVNRKMETNLPGVYAAGDCTGRPYQVSKAVGEGLIAALCAAEYLDEQEKSIENKE